MVTTGFRPSSGKSALAVCGLNPTLTKTNYVEWAVVMRIRLQVRHMWEPVRHGDVNYDEDQRAPRSGLPRRPGTPSLRHASEATALASPHCRHFARSGRTWPSSQVRMLMTFPSVSTLLQKMVQYGDDTYDEERAVEKLFRCVRENYRQIARSIESLLDLSTMSIEEALGRLKVVDSDEPQPLSGPITIGGKLHLTQEQWEASQGDKRKGESSSPTGGRKPR
jgi:hypothetical protein